MSNHPLDLSEAASWLAKRGLNLAGSLPTSGWSNSWANGEELSRNYPITLVIGSSGPQFWTALQAEGFLNRAHPVDDFAATTIAHFAKTSLRGAKPPIAYRILWPNPDLPPVPLTRLGQRLGWSHRSPMGLGIHPQRGLWFAYRAVLALALPAVTLEGAEPTPPPHKNGTEEFANSPCLDCPTQPCITACPVGAVGGATGLALEPCFTERIREGADCEDQCLSRLACPVGCDHQYPAAAQAHHHRAATQSWLNWSKERDQPMKAPAEWKE